MAKLKASTLLEVVVSLVIISTVMSIALMTYVNVIESDDLTRKTEANLFINKLSNDIKSEQQFVDEIITVNEITYQTSFVEFDKTKGLVLMEIVATNNQEKELAKHKEIFLDD